MAIDTNRLIKDAEERQKVQPHRSSAGTYAAIRDALPSILRMRQNGIGWKAIAEAFAEQGVTQRKDGEDIPITTTRLTALVSDMKKKDARQTDRLARRKDRPDIASESKKPARTKQFALSSELVVKAHDATSPPELDGEEEIRRDQFDAIKGLLKTKD